MEAFDTALNDYLDRDLKSWEVEEFEEEYFDKLFKILLELQPTPYEARLATNNLINCVDVEDVEDEEVAGLMDNLKIDTEYISGGHFYKSRDVLDVEQVLKDVADYYIGTYELKIKKIA